MGVWISVASAVCAALMIAGSAGAISLDLQDDDSIKSAASTIAHGMMQYYSGNQSGQVPGLLPSPYYWWEAGAMFGSLIDYWYYTGDTTYNEVVTEAMLFQVGPEVNYMPPNQSKSLGNDDQAFWGIAAMSAAEVKFPDPQPEQAQWLALAQAVFDSQAPRWDTSTCGGGLRWQIYSFNNGYDYKNSISNGCFFNLAARLGAYTHNRTYLDWATRSWEWSENIGLIGDQYHVFDGSDDTINCTELNHKEWSYNLAVYLLGASVMWNQTEGAVRDQWRRRVDGLLETAKSFFDGQIMYEFTCEPHGNCNIDQQSFKAYMSRWMAASTKLAPWIYDTVMPYLAASAEAAAKACSGGDDGVSCGMKWTTGSFDGLTGVGEQMNALEVIQSNLIERVNGPLSNTTGGTSKGGSTAGSTGSNLRGPENDEITTADRAGAGILTALIVGTLLGGAWWMIK